MTFTAPALGPVFAGLLFLLASLFFMLPASPASAQVSITISPQSLPDAQIGNAYSQSLTADGGAAPYSFRILSGLGTLPPGFTLASNGTISGEPTAAGAFSFWVVAQDANGNLGGRYYGITIQDTLLISPPTLPFVTANVPYSRTLAASGGVGQYTFELLSGNLFTGLSLSADGLLSGQTNVSGSAAFVVRATDSAGNSGTRAYVIRGGPQTGTISPTALPDAAFQQPYSERLTAGGGVAPYVFSVISGSLPAGLSLSSDGAVSGTPTNAGTNRFVVAAIDSTGVGARQEISLTVSQAPVTVSPETVPVAKVGLPYNQTFTADGGNEPYTFSQLGSRPAGMTFSADGRLTGTPAYTGTYEFTVYAQDADGSKGSRTYSLVVDPLQTTIEPRYAPAAEKGAPYSLQFTASGGAVPYTFEFAGGSLPDGLDFSPSGLLSGTPTTARSTAFAIKVTDANGQVDTLNLSFLTTSPDIVLTPDTLPHATAGINYSQTFAATGGQAPYTFLSAGLSLPAGLSLSSTTGELSGKPTMPGTYQFGIFAVDANGIFGSARSYTMIVDGEQIVISPSLLPNGAVGEAYSQTLTATNGTAPYTFAAQGPLPGGLSLAANGKLTGTPTVAGSFPFSVVATDANGVASRQYVYTMTIDAAQITISPAIEILSHGAVGHAYSQTFTAANGTAPYTFTLQGTLPDGLSLAANGELTGTPTAVGRSQFTLVATDANGVASPQYSYTLTVDPFRVTISPKTLPDAVVGQAYTAKLEAAGGVGPYAFQVVSGDFLAGLTLSETGGITGASTAAGTRSVAVRATDSNGLSGIQVITLTTSQPPPRPDPSKDPEVLGLLRAQADATRRLATSQIDNMQQRLETLHSSAPIGDGVAFANGITLSFADDCSNAERADPNASCGGGALPAFDGFRKSPSAGALRGSAALALWTAGSISVGERNGGAGYDFTTSGLSAGVDYRLSRAFTLGFGLGYGHDSSDVGSNGSHVKTDAATAALYGSYHPGNGFFLDTLAGYQWLSIDTHRFVTGDGSFIDGSRDGTQWFASATAGGEFNLHDWMVSPYARFDIARASLEAYSENSTSPLALSYGRQQVDTSTASLGLRLEHDIAFDSATLTPQLRFEYQHDFHDNGAVTLNYADGLGPIYLAELDGMARDRFVLGLGAQVRTVNDMALNLSYRGMFGADSQDHGFRLGIQKQF